MHHRILAALALVCVMSLPSHAKPNETRETLFRAKDAIGVTISVKPRSSSVLSIARRYLGTNPTKMRRLWCHNFANMVLAKAGKRGSGSNFARSGLKIGKPVSLASARPGDLVILARGKGGHSGFFMGRTANGRVQLISGNTRGRVVGISAYAPGRVLGVRRVS